MGPQDPESEAPGRCPTKGISLLIPTTATALHVLYCKQNTERLFWLAATSGKPLVTTDGLANNNMKKGAAKGWGLARGRRNGRIEERPSHPRAHCRIINK